MSTENNNNIEQLLFSLGLASPDTVSIYADSTRDNESVKVKRCSRSGVIYISSNEHVDTGHYEHKKGYKFAFPEHDSKRALIASKEDTNRRQNAVATSIANKKWLDFGTGHGGILRALAEIAEEAVGVEPQATARQDLKEAGFEAVYPDLKNIRKDHYDFISAFHVVEHLRDPITTLSDLQERLVPGGRIHVEVPHARDFLLTWLQSEPFKRFTLWSEHLVLHTRQTLEVFLQEAGFRDIVVRGIQRYPLANHLHWLVQGKPGGHLKWPLLRDAELDRRYADLLSGIDGNDTLVAEALK